MNKIAFLVLAGLIASIPVAAAEPTPIARNILGCYAVQSNEAAKTNNVYLVYRNSADLPVAYESEASLYGKLYILAYQEEPTCRELKGNQFHAEGLGELPKAPNGQTWDTPAPAGAFFSARGDTNGFFLVDNSPIATAKFVDSGLFRLCGYGNVPVTEFTLDMVCTQDATVLKGWYESIRELAAKQGFWP